MITVPVGVDCGCVLYAKARDTAVLRFSCSSSMCCSALKLSLRRAMKRDLDSMRWDLYSKSCQLMLLNAVSCFLNYLL